MRFKNVEGHVVKEEALNTRVDRNGQVKSCYEMSDCWKINMDDKLRHINSYQPGHRLYLPRPFVVLFSHSRQKTTQCIEFSHDHFLTRLLIYYHRVIRHFTARVTGEKKMWMCYNKQTIFNCEYSVRVFGRISNLKSRTDMTFRRKIGAAALGDRVLGVTRWTF